MDENNNYELEAEQEALKNDNISEKILQAAYEITQEEGFDNLTIRKIAKKSGCSNTAIYVRFADKEQLKYAVAEKNAAMFREILQGTYNESDDLFTNIRNMFRGILHRMFELEWETVNIHLFYISYLSPDANPYFVELKKHFQNAINAGDIKAFDTDKMVQSILIAFGGLLYYTRVNNEVDYPRAKELLDEQLNMIFHGIRIKTDEDIFWEILSERGVNVDKALSRMKNNKVAYKQFLYDFFEDPDFESLRVCLAQRFPEDAFDYAHGLKGMAANLGLDDIYEAICVLVEILRRGSLDGAQEAYEGVMAECKKVKSVLSK